MLEEQGNCKEMVEELDVALYPFNGSISDLKLEEILRKAKQVLVARTRLAADAAEWIEGGWVEFVGDDFPPLHLDGIIDDIRIDATRERDRLFKLQRAVQLDEGGWLWA